MLTQILQ